MRTVVCDAGPVIHLHEAGLLHLLTSCGSLTDDAAARLFAATLGMEVHGSLGVVLWNVARRHLDQEQGL